jgi:putative Mg2+ transporter-C (MgtC) family protein
LTRIAAQVVTGISFLCSGIIIKEGLNIKGINTAATIWCTAAIGVTCSSGYIVFSAIANALVLACNLLFMFADTFIQPLTHQGAGNSYVLSVSCHAENEFDIRSEIITKLDDDRCILDTEDVLCLRNPQ